MHTALLDRSLKAFVAVRKHVSFSANLRSQIGASMLECKAEGAKCFDAGKILGEAADGINWRVIDHCAAVTRTYALFESFVMQILREYLAFLSGAYTLRSLGDEFSIRYTRGIGKILQEQGKHRYRDLDVAAVISGASDAMTGKSGYHLQAEALLRAEQNLRMSELHRLFSDCGLSGIENWTPPETPQFRSEGELLGLMAMFLVGDAAGSGVE